MRLRNEGHRRQAHVTGLHEELREEGHHLGVGGREREHLRSALRCTGTGTPSAPASPALAEDALSKVVQELADQWRQRRVNTAVVVSSATARE